MPSTKSCQIGSPIWTEPSTEGPRRYFIVQGFLYRIGQLDRILGRDTSYTSMRDTTAYAAGWHREDLDLKDAMAAYRFEDQQFAKRSYGRRDSL